MFVSNPAALRLTKDGLNFHLLFLSLPLPPRSSDAFFGFVLGSGVGRRYWGESGRAVAPFIDDVSEIFGFRAIAIPFLSQEFYLLLQGFYHSSFSNLLPSPVSFGCVPIVASLLVCCCGCRIEIDRD